MSEAIDIPELKELLIDKDEIEEGNEFFIDKFLGLGGSGNVYRAKVMQKNEKLSLNYGMDVALKLCNPDMTYYGCLDYKKEAGFTNIFSSLNYHKICYNYPIVYGFFHSCIFFTKSESEAIINYIEDNNIDRCRDAFIIYCVSPEHIEIDEDILKTLLENYDPKLLKESRDIFPKTQNVKGLYFMSLSLKGNNNWETNHETYDYLYSLPDLNGCDMFILLQYLKGFTLMDLMINNPGLKFSDTLFFESVYSTISSIFFLHTIQTDRKSDNAMIVTTRNPRIYLYKENYYIVTGDTFYWIDINRLSEDYISNIVKSHIKFFNYFTEEQQRVINHIFEGKDYTSPEKFLDLLFNWISSKVIILNKEQITEYMVINYNYRLCIADKLL